MPGPTVIIHLCSRCAKKHGVNDPTGFGLADLLVAVSKKKKTLFNQANNCLWLPTLTTIDEM
jgi:hypothetical protein